jgi:cytidylate kinase
VAPLHPAPDAVLIDTDDLDVDQVVERILQHVGRRSAQ